MGQRRTNSSGSSGHGDNGRPNRNKPLNVAPSENGGKNHLIGRRIAVATGADRSNRRNNSNNNNNSNTFNNNSNANAPQSKKNKKRGGNGRRNSSYNDSQLLTGTNRHTNGSLYSALAKDHKKGSGRSDSEGENELSNDVVLLDSDEEDASKTEKSTGEGTAVPAEADDAKNAENTTDTNGLTSNQDFIAFDFSDDEKEEEEEEEEEHGDEDEAQGAKNERYSPSYNAPEADSRKRKRDLSDDEGAQDTSHNRHTAVPKKRQDVSLEFPWISRGDHSQEPEVSDWLTKEIKDFVAYVSPSEAEIHARNDAVTRIRKVVTKMWYDAEVRVFGSYATDMYLPGSDIDMVILSDSGKYDSRAYLYQLSSRLKSSGIATSVEVIAKARVPIIKFVEIQSGIHIDVSFERTNGIEAVDTIRGWAQEFKCLRYLVMVVKQFLARRRMNNVHTGGMGGYSVICTVANFLKMHPKLASGVMDAERNLGVLMIEYFELYGKHFNYDNVALKMSGEMGYLPKRRYPDMQPTVAHRTFALAIQDPADSSNNISRGSFNIRGIKKAFGGAFDMLTARCYELENLSMKKRRGLSILGNIIRVKGPERDFIDSTGKVQNIAQDESPLPTPKRVYSPPPPPPKRKQPPPPPAPSRPASVSKPAKNEVEYMAVSSDDEDDGKISVTPVKTTKDKPSPPKSTATGTTKAKAEDYIVIDSDSDSDDANNGYNDDDDAPRVQATPVATRKLSNSSPNQDSRTSAIKKSTRRDYWAGKNGISSI